METTNHIAFIAISAWWLFPNDVSLGAPDLHACRCSRFETHGRLPCSTQGMTGGRALSLHRFQTLLAQSKWLNLRTFCVPRDDRSSLARRIISNSARSFCEKETGHAPPDMATIET